MVGPSLSLRQAEAADISCSLQPWCGLMFWQVYVGRFSAAGLLARTCVKNAELCFN